jgi:hypothetical protein
VIPTVSAAGLYIPVFASSVKAIDGNNTVPSGKVTPPPIVKDDVDNDVNAPLDGVVAPIVVESMVEFVIALFKKVLFSTVITEKCEGTDGSVLRMLLGIYIIKCMKIEFI